MIREQLSTAGRGKIGSSNQEDTEMSRQKAPRPIPLWVTQEAMAKRAGEQLRQVREQRAAAVPAPARSVAPAKPILVASNPMPIAKSLIGRPRPKLVAADDQIDRDMTGLLAKFELLEYLDNRTDDNPNVGG